MTPDEIKEKINKNRISFVGKQREAHVVPVFFFEDNGKSSHWFNMTYIYDCYIFREEDIEHFVESLNEVDTIIWRRDPVPKELEFYPNENFWKIRVCLVKDGKKIQSTFLLMSGEDQQNILKETIIPAIEKSKTRRLN